MRRRDLLATATGALAAGTARAQPLADLETGAPAPDFAVRSADGRVVRLSALRGRPVVLEWTNPVCPFTAKKYAAGAFAALQGEAAARGFAWLAVDTAAPSRPGHLTAAAARARIAAQHMHVTAFLLDEDGRLGRLYGARTTPSAYVIGADGRLLYQGAVDDDPWSEAPPAALSALRAALDDVAAHRPVRRTQTRPYGCPVEY